MLQAHFTSETFILVPGVAFGKVLFSLHHERVQGQRCFSFPGKRH